MFRLILILSLFYCGLSQDTWGKARPWRVTHATQEIFEYLPSNGKQLNAQADDFMWKYFNACMAVANHEGQIDHATHVRDFHSEEEEEDRKELKFLYSQLPQGRFFGLTTFGMHPEEIAVKEQIEERIRELEQQLSSNESDESSARRARDELKEEYKKLPRGRFFGLTNWGLTPEEIDKKRTVKRKIRGVERAILSQQRHLDQLIDGLSPLTRECEKREGIARGRFPNGGFDEAVEGELCAISSKYRTENEEKCEGILIAKQMQHQQTGANRCDHPVGNSHANDQIGKLYGQTQDILSHLQGNRSSDTFEEDEEEEDLDEEAKEEEHPQGQGNPKGQNNRQIAIPAELLRRAQSNDPDAQYELASLLHDENQIEEAKKLYLMTIAHKGHPAAAKAHAALGYILENQPGHNLDEVEDHYLKSAQGGYLRGMRNYIITVQSRAKEQKIPVQKLLQAKTFLEQLITQKKDPELSQWATGFRAQIIEQAQREGLQSLFQSSTSPTKPQKPQKITIYTIEGCPYCIKAKALLQARGVPYEEVLLTSANAATEKERLFRLTGMKTVPQIFVGDEVIGGYSHLAEKDKNDGLQSVKEKMDLEGGAE